MFLVSGRSRQFAAMGYAVAATRARVASYRGGVARGLLLAIIALGANALSPTAPAATVPAPLYTLAASQSCLMSLPNAVAGLPPATPPVPSALFVDALARDTISTAEGEGPRPRVHKQLGTWYGDGSYQGIILSFFKTVPDARASLKKLAWLYGGKRIRNVVVTWDQRSLPSPGVRATVLGCLRSDAVGGSERPAPPASLATFAGTWGGHGRSLTITSSGRGRESANDGCCTRVYRMTFQILSVTGTLTQATAAYRVTSFKRYVRGVRRLRVGDVGQLRLRNGIVTSTLTRDYFCSDPAWGATGACGL